jgi:hypothetical protein
VPRVRDMGVKTRDLVEPPLQERVRLKNPRSSQAPLGEVRELADYDKGR